MVRPPSRPALLLAGLLALASGVTCTDSTGPKARVRALVGIAPVFSKAATQIYHKLVSFELGLDNVHVRLERANGDVAIDTTVVIAPGQTEIVLKLSVVIEGQSEDFEATIELRDGTQVLFAGTQIITARVGVTSTPPPPVPVEYTGPGSTVTTLDVQPDTTISGAQSIVMRPVALDANNNPVTDLALLWYLGENQSAAPAVDPRGTVTQDGVFQPTGVRGSVVVSAELPTGLKGSATVNIVPPASALSLVSGDGQTGVVGSALAPIVVQVLATDGLPVVGHAISFVVAGGGGSVVPTSTVTDANGRASAVLTLGTAVGLNSLEITAAGLAPITVSATATAVPSTATALAFTQQPSNGTAGAVLPAVQVEVRDQLGNRVTTGSAATANVSVALVDGTLTGTTSVAAVAGVATFNALTVVSPGTHRLVASSPGLTSATSNTFSIAAAGTGTTRSWTGGGGTEAWETPSNWSGGVVPAATDTAVISVGETSVTISSAVSVGKVVVGSGTGTQILIVLGPNGSLTVSDSLRVAPTGALILQGDVAGTVLGGGRVLIQGTAQWVFGAITGSNPIVVAEGGSFLMGTTAGLNLGRTLENHGLTMLLSGTPGNLTLSNGASIENSGEFQTQGPVGIVQGAGAAGSFLNFGFFRQVIGNNGTATIGVPYTNSGTTEVMDGIVHFTGTTLTNTVTGVMRGTGSFDIDAGTFTNAGTISPGLSPGELEVFGALPMQGTSRIEIELGGTAEGTEYDALHVDGPISLSGMLEISLINGFQPQVGQTFTIMEFSSRTGSFANIVGLNLGGGLELVPQFSSTSLTLVVQSAAAATIAWSNPAGGAWSTPSNWSLNRVPNSSDIVGIDLAGTYTVTLDVDVAYTIAGLILGGTSGTQTLSGDLNSLEINGNTIISSHGALNLVGSSIIGTGSVTNQGAVTLRNTSVGATVAWSNQGTVTTHSNVTFNGIVVTTEGSTFWVQGQSATTTGNVVLTFASGFTNNGLIELTSLQEAAAQLTVTNGTLVNAPSALIRSAFGQDGGNRTVSAHLDNRGTLFVETPLTVDRAGSQLLNTGSIELFADLTVTGDFGQPPVGSLTARIGGPALFHSLSVSGTATLGGSLNVALLDGFVPVVTNSFAMLTYSSRASNFGEINLPELPAGLAWTTDVGATEVRLTVTGASSATISWINSAGGNWSVGSNWSTGVVPTSSDIVGIELPGTYTVTLDVNPPTLAGLIVGGASGTQNLSGESRTLAFNGSMDVRTNGVVALSSSSSLAGTGTVTNEGTIQLTGSTVFASTTLDNRNVLRLRGTILINGPLLTTSTSNIQVEGSSPGGNASATVASSFTNSGSLELRSVDGAFAAAVTVSTGTLTNSPSGLIMSSLGTGGGGARTLTAQIDNQGTLVVAHPLNIGQSNAVQVNNGTIALSGANLSIGVSGTGSFVNNNSITISAARVLQVTGGAVDLTQGSVTGDPTGRLVVSAATLTFTPPDVAVPLTLSSTTVAGGAITIGDGETLTLFASTVGANVTVESGGTLVTLNSTTLNGTFSVAADGVLRVPGQSNGSNASLTVNTGFINSGTIELTSFVGTFSSTLTVNSGTLTNSSTGRIWSRPGFGGVRTLAAPLDNQGTLEVDWPLTMDRAGADHLNTGTIDLTDVAAGLTITQTGTTPSFANPGNINLGAGRTLTVTGGELTVAGLISGAATSTLFATNVTSFVFTPATVTIPMTLTNTFVNGDGITIGSDQTLTLLNGGVTTSISVGAGGTLLTLGTVSVSTVSMPTATSTLRVRGQSFGSNAALTVASGFTNNGLIDLTSADGTFSSTLAVTSLPLINATGATIRSDVGASGLRTLNVELDNRGTLQVDHPLTLEKQHAHHENTGSGIIDLQSEPAANLTVSQPAGDAPSFQNAGSIALGAGRVFSVTGGSLDLLEGTVTGTATSLLSVTSATLAFSPATVAIPMTLTTTSISGGTVNIGAGETVTLLNGGLADAVAVNGGTLLIHGTVALSQAPTVTSTGTVRIRGQLFGGTGALVVSSAFTNNGLIELTSADGTFAASLVVNNGILTNMSTIHSDVGAQGLRILDARLDNQNQLDVDWPLTINRAEADHSNSGTIDLTNSDLTLQQSGDSPTFTNTSDGTISLGSGRFWSITGGTLDLGAGNVTGSEDGSSRLFVTNAILGLDLAHVNLVALTLTNTTIAGNSILVGDGRTLTLRDGTIAATDAINVQSGGLFQSLGTVALNGPLSVASGGTLKVIGQLIGGTATLTVANSFTNNGQITLTSNDGTFASTLAVTNGPLINENGAVIHSDVGSQGFRILAAELNNQPNGTVTVDWPLTLNKPSALHVNGGGLIDLAGAGMTITQTGTNPSFTNNGTIQLHGHALTVTGGPLHHNLSDAQAIVGPGTLDVGTNLESNGEIQPAGTLNVTGNFPQGATGNLNIQISPSGSSTCAVSDQLVVTGAATLTAPLNVSLNDCVLPVNQPFTILTAASINGTFGYTPIAIQGGTLNISYSSTQVTLVFNIP